MIGCLLVKSLALPVPIPIEGCREHRRRGAQTTFTNDTRPPQASPGKCPEQVAFDGGKQQGRRRLETPLRGLVAASATERRPAAPRPAVLSENTLLKTRENEADKQHTRCPDQEGRGKGRGMGFCSLVCELRNQFWPFTPRYIVRLRGAPGIHGRF